MSSPEQMDEDEVEEDVEFVSEAPIRPVSEYIDLLSDSDGEGCSSSAGTIEDKISRQKARVSSTLDKLAQQVAQEKKKRADKCRAFKEKQTLQKARGQQELSSVTAENGEAKRCVDMWLKMPGVQPGTLGTGVGRRRRSAPMPLNVSLRNTCPVINCGRVYDHVSLLDGHLKRFDHSPCDPTIHLKGNPAELFACVACGRHFQDKDAWRNHLDSKVFQESSGAPGAHSVTQTYQRIVAFACPSCYFLFNLRDECLQHMSAKNHFTHSLAMSESGGSPSPVPVPQLVKNALVASCRDVSFSIRCSLCHKLLKSHQAAQAHFNVHCRQGCAVATAEKTVAQVAQQLQVRGQCATCRLLFLTRAEVQRHEESTRHDVEINETVAKALLQHGRFREGRMIEPAERQSPAPKRTRDADQESDECGTKRQRVAGGGNSAVAWACECGLTFPEETAAATHLLAANQIFHQCGVCGKRMGETAIARLHMSRFHGGAHLSNFLFHCRKCRVEMPRREDILLHVAHAHQGHTYYSEREVGEVADAGPSAGSDAGPSTSSAVPATVPTPRLSSWMCRMCEDVFDSESSVRRHCGDPSTHSFQRFVCGHCPQKFFKESTVRRHCINEHGGDVRSSHFCGLCDSMEFDAEAEFLAHYASLHSKDYYCIDGAGDVLQPLATTANTADVLQPLATTANAAATTDAQQPVSAATTDVLQPLANAAATATSASATTDVLQPDAADNSAATADVLQLVADAAAPLSCPCMSSEKSQAERKATYTRCMKALSADRKCRYVCAPCGVSAPDYARMKTHVHTKHAALNLDRAFDVECMVCARRFEGVPDFHRHFHARHCPLQPCAASRSREERAVAEKVQRTAENIDESDGETEQTSPPIDEEAKESAEMEEALKRSLLEF